MNYSKTFQQQGYVIIEEAYSPEALQRFRDYLQDLVEVILAKAKRQHPDKITTPKTGELIDQSLLTLREYDPNYVTEVQRIISRSAEFLQLSAQENMMRIAKEVLGIPQQQIFYITNNGVLFTAPNFATERTASNIQLPWHNDIFHTIPHSNFIQIWAPLLHDATEEIGALIVCPGSHKNGVGEQLFNKDDLFFYRYLINPAATERYEKVSVKLKLGQALLFSGSLYHKSGINTSKDKVRCTLGGVYHDIRQAVFRPLVMQYKYLGQTPEEWYYELFAEEGIKPLLKENAYPTK